MGKHIGKVMIKDLSGKYSQKLLDHAKLSGTDAFKTNSKRPIQKISEAFDELTDIKIADKIPKVSKS